MRREKILSQIESKNKNLGLICLHRTDSTNNYAKAHIPAHGAIAVTADTQIGGKGRLGRSFSSPPGGLYLSIGFRPWGHPPDECMHYTALTALAVSNGVERVYAVKPQIKWPNDLLLKGKKICGMLLEAVHEPQGYYIIAGIGLNAANPMPPELRDKAGNLSELTGQERDLEDLAAGVINEFFTVMAGAHSDKESLMSEYARRCVTIGRKVEAVSPSGGAIKGIARGISPDGGLIIERPHGERVVVISGEVTLSNS